MIFFVFLGVFSPMPKTRMPLAWGLLLTALFLKMVQVRICKTEARRPLFRYSFFQ